MDFFCVFAISFLAGILEIHLSDKNVGDSIITLCFALQGGIYLICCLTIGSILTNPDERYVMIGSTITLCIAYLILIPWSLVFPDDTGIIIASIPLFGIGEALVYRNL
jgi:hypothetical protein